MMYIDRQEPSSNCDDSANEQRNFLYQISKDDLNTKYLYYILFESIGHIEG